MKWNKIFKYKKLIFNILLLFVILVMLIQGWTLIRNGFSRSTSVSLTGEYKLSDLTIDIPYTREVRLNKLLMKVKDGRLFATYQYQDSINVLYTRINKNGKRSRLHISLHESRNLNRKELGEFSITYTPEIGGSSNNTDKAFSIVYDCEKGIHRVSYDLLKIEEKIDFNFISETFLKPKISFDKKPHIGFEKPKATVHKNMNFYFSEVSTADKKRLNFETIPKIDLIATELFTYFENVVD